METPLYHYEPLQHSDSIRILVLHPSPTEADPIACTLRHIQLSDVPSERRATSDEDYILECSRIFFEQFSEDIPWYEAVSYTWGDCTQTNTIYFNDGRQRLVVGKNCHAALRRLRLVDEDRTVWIDAVCINQQDLLERASQVCMMKDVYDCAEGVMVMLGDEVPDSRLLMDQLTHVVNNWQTVVNKRRITPYEAVAQQLKTLYKDPWFERTWVLQEVHAKERITIVYGSAIFPFRALERLHVGFGRFESQFPPPIWIVCRRMIEYCTSQFSLWNRLYETRECLATNPRDKVFALKSLLGPRQSDLDYLIDYTQSVESCFTQVAGFLLPVLDLRILAATRHPHNLNMASWIPDWSQNLPLDFTKFSFESEEAMREGCFSLNATTGDHERTLQPYTISDLRNDATMLVVGCQYARIIDCSKTFRFVDYNDAATQMRNVYNEFDNLRQNLDEESKHDTATVSGHFSTKTIEKMSHMCGEDLRESLMRDHCSCNRPYSILNDTRHLYNALQLCNISLMDNDQLVIVPETAQPGDIVCILRGTAAPCLLRRDRDGCWVLVSGDCHIFGVHWETMSESDDYVESNQDRVETFTLR